MDPIIEETKAGIPESITLNGVTYSVKDTPELQQFIQSVAKVEKSKLYSQFESLRNQIDNLNRVKVTDGFSVDAIVDKLKETFVTKETLSEMLPATLKEVVQPLLSASEQSKQDELRMYRERLITENSATCIPDLVVGSTKEELDAALQKSIELRAKYPSPSSAAFEGKHVTDPNIQKQFAEQGDYTPTPTPAPAAPQIPAAPRRPSPEAGLQPNVKTMSMNEFERNRENLHAQLESLYGGSTL